jgi:hypothetical protein
MVPFLLIALSLLLSLNDTELILCHLFSETRFQDITSRLLASMVPEEGSAVKDVETPIAVKVRSLVYSVQMLPDWKLVLAM